MAVMPRTNVIPNVRSTRKATATQRYRFAFGSVVISGVLESVTGCRPQTADRNESRLVANTGRPLVFVQLKAIADRPKVEVEVEYNIIGC